MKRLAFLLLLVTLVSCEETPTGKSPQVKPEKAIPLPPEKPEVVEVPIILETPEIVEEIPPPPPEVIDIDWIIEEEWEEEPIEEIIDFPSIEASFPGGPEALIKFVNGGLDYPDIAVEMEVEGTVFVRFLVEKDGSITNVRVIKRVQDNLDREAKRVIRRMPRWIPAEKEGRRVESEHTIPIAFQIN